MNLIKQKRWILKDREGYSENKDSGGVRFLATIWQQDKLFYKMIERVAFCGSGL